VSVDGGPPIKMADAPSPAFLGGAWTGRRRIVYLRRPGPVRVSAGGGVTPERFDEDISNTAFVASPVVRPGGRAVMYGVVDNGAERVAVFDLDAREQKIIIDIRPERVPTRRVSTSSSHAARRSWPRRSMLPSSP
jgi:hypothetical protein